MMVWLHQSGAGPPMGSMRFFDTCSLAATNDISFAGMALNPPDREVQQGVPFKTDIPKDSIRSYPYMAFRLKYSQATLDEKVHHSNPRKRVPSDHADHIQKHRCYLGAEKSDGNEEGKLF
jgi:hypothetical protein